MVAIKLIAKWAIALSLFPLAAQDLQKPGAVEITVMDDAGAPVAGALVEVQPLGSSAVRLVTNQAGRVTYVARAAVPYHIHTEKSGFFQSEVDQSDPTLGEVQIVLMPAKMLVQNVDVSAKSEGIDPQELSDATSMEVRDILNIPYPSDRDIRELLQFFPGSVRGHDGQTHLVGSDSGSVLDVLDGFDIRSPFDGRLSMRFSADAVHSITTQTTRYPVEYGRNTGGVIAFRTGMGDDKLRFNVTDFMPQFEEEQGLRFENFVPRLTLSGPIRRNQSWFFDGLESEMNVDYVPQLPKGAQTNITTRGSNLFRVQWDPSPDTIVTTGLLFNDFHSPFTGLSPEIPRESTRIENTIAWFPYARLQHRFGGALLEMGFGVVRFNTGSRPQLGVGPFQIQVGHWIGPYFATDNNLSQSVQSTGTYYFQPRRWLGVHDLKAGVDLDQTRFTMQTMQNPVQYLRGNGSILRLSTFESTPSYTRHNLAAGVYMEDHWSTGNRWLFEPGVRFDWNEVTRQPTGSPRISVAWIPPRAKEMTKIAAGIGIYYEHTQLDYIARSLDGDRYDVYYGDRGVAPVGPPMTTRFVYYPGTLKQPYAINWSVGLEQQLPGHVYVKANFIHKQVLHELTYVDSNGGRTPGGTYVLTNNRIDRVREFDIQAKHTFRGGYTLFGAYTRSSALTNAAIDYNPSLSDWGPQQSGPLPWDSPNRFISWGWLPFPRVNRDWQFVYSLSWRTGFPFTPINADQKVMGPPDSLRFPDFFSFNPGVQVKLHVLGYHLSLRSVVENATDSPNPNYVDPYVDSPHFRHFYNSPGRAFTVRLQVLDSKHLKGLFR